MNGLDSGITATGRSGRILSHVMRMMSRGWLTLLACWRFDERLISPFTSGEWFCGALSILTFVLTLGVFWLARQVKMTEIHPSQDSEKDYEKQAFSEVFQPGSAVSSVGRALPRHGRGHKFKSCTAHQPL